MDSHGVLSFNKRKYCLVIFDEHSRFTWVYFLRHKNHIVKIFMDFTKIVENERD